MKKVAVTDHLDNSSRPARWPVKQRNETLLNPVNAGLGVRFLVEIVPYIQNAEIRRVVPDEHAGRRFARLSAFEITFKMLGHETPDTRVGY